MEKFTMFPYSWHMDEDEEDFTAIRVYGLDNNNENVCVRIDNFTPFVYLELPENVPWTVSKAQQVGNKLDTMLGDRKPLVKRLMYKKRLYYAHLDQKGRRKKFPYLFLSFSHQSDIRNMSYKIRRPLNIIGIGNIKVKMHEQDASPILQFVSYRNVSTAGWIDFVGKRIGKDDQITRCDHEFKVRWKNVTPNTIPTVAAPLIMGFDIEVNSTNPSAMPKAEKPGDKVFQISCVLFRHGDDEKNMEKCLLTLGEPDPKTVGEDTEIYMYETEHDLLIGYTEFIQEKNPNIIVGYNILNFDIPYMIDRAKMNYCIFDFDQQGFNRYGHAKEKTIKWSSSAYGNQTFQFLDAEGRLYVDLLPLVKRDYKMDNYKLKTISTFFLGCVDPNTPILTWGGSKKLAKDIQIGDELIGDDGTKRTVQDICEGVDDMYEIHQHKFDNYIVNSQHILTFKISGHCSIYWLDKKKMWTMGWLDMNKRKFRFKSMSTTRTTKTKEDVYEDMVNYRNTLDTNDILEIKVKDYLTLPDSVKNKLKGYKTSGVQWKHQDVPIDPYIFGMWLGDGDSDGRGFASQDKELIEKWESWCSNNNAKVEHSKRYNYRIKHISGQRCTPPLKTILKKHELFNNKHIPSIYLQNDRKTRLSLLAGLIDTDGYVGSNGRCIIITQVRKELSEQILYLARSLGMSAFCKKRHTKWTWNNETKYGYAYEVAISGEGLEDIPTILGYKKCLKRQQKKDSLVSGIKITHIGKGSFNGWQIDGNERFLLGDFTVTHNSTKDPLSVKGIFKCYRIGIKNKDGVYSRQAQKAMGIVGKYCLCENTRVSGKHGSIPIENLYGENLEVLSWNEKTDKLEISVQSNFLDNGKKECIELELEDGRTIICTPDHKLVTENGWINADDIPVGGKVKVGPILPEVELDTNETIYARVLGYMITDGHISKQRCVGYFGNLLDAQVFCDDIKTLCGIKPEIRKKSLDNCWLVSLPKNMKYKLLAENWIKGGNRTGSKELLPDVSKWSKSQIREFIAGMFGGDGWCPCYNKGDDKFTPIGLTQSRNNKDDIDEYVEKLSNMLKMFDISSSIRIAKRDNLFIGSLSLSMHDIEKFVTTIGYRYCYHKTIRSSIATFYYRIKNKAIRAYKQFYDQVITSDMSIAGAYREYVNRYTYAPTYGTMKSWARKGFPTGRPDQACRSFPKVGQFLNRMNVIKLFEGDDYHSYSLDKNCDTLPTFELSLISKKSVGIKQVYDITVEDTHSFLANGIVAHNCVQDSALVIRLFNKLRTWIGLCEMAKTCNVPIFYLYTQGQQIKVYSQLYKYCMYKNFVVEKDGYVPKDNEHYVGATVFEPKAGVYDRVIPFDFASLYPTTIIAYNIDYSTLVTDPSVPDSDCHVMEWEDHVGCEHDKSVRKTKPKHVMCDKRYFRFLKEPKGVMPTVLQNLLDARAHTRKQIKVINKILDKKDIDEKECKMVEELIPDVLKILTEKKKIPTQRNDELKTLTEVLEKRQLAYKVSANSMYGAMGVTRGYLPFMPGAMATTAMGRKNIGIVAETIPKKFGGKLIYGDTDSNYIVFPHLETAAENWDHALHVATEVTKMFPAPICLEFENEIYWRFFILTKKRYMYKKCMRDGVVDEKIGKKGVLLARRDNSMFIRNAYETLIMMVFNRKTREEILFYIIDIINKLCSHFYSYKDFIVTKSIGSHGGGQVVPFINEKGQKKGKMGDYTVPLLSTEPKERERQFKLKNCNNAKDYYTHCLPAVVQLAERMRQRGQRVDPGTRLEYVISDQGGHKAKQYVKVEDAIYFSQHSSVLKLDYMYYMKLMANPFDDVLNVIYNVDDGSKNAFQKDFVLKQYKFRLNVRTKVLNELKDLIAPTVTFGK